MALNSEPPPPTPRWLLSSRSAFHSCAAYPVRRRCGASTVRPPCATPRPLLTLLTVVVGPASDFFRRSALANAEGYYDGCAQAHPSLTRTLLSLALILDAPPQPCASPGAYGH